MHELKSDVSDYRNHEIADEKGPANCERNIIPICWTGVSIGSGRIYPTEKDIAKTSGEVPEILIKLEDYITNIIAYIFSNNNKTSLMLV